MGGKKGKSGEKKSGKSKVPVIEFQEGVREFVFENGDKYTGQFMAHRSGLAWREGRGVYVTHDGQTYEGDWKDDKLINGQNASVLYQNGDAFYGTLTKYKYNGEGTYSFANGSHLVCQFANNKPAGDLVFIDYLGNIWYGKSENETARFLQEHAFSSELDWERGKTFPNSHKIKMMTSASAESSSAVSKSQFSSNVGDDKENTQEK